MVRPTRTSRFRAEIIELHRQIYARNQQRINAATEEYSPAFLRYERRYQQGVRSYRSRVTFPRVLRAVDHADLVYVGDYHTLRQAQRTVVRLLRPLLQDRREIVLALEFVQARYQDTLDAWMADQIDDDELLEGIDHSNHWVFDGWENFKPIMEVARQNQLRVLGIDWSGPERPSLADRDRFMAERIAEVVVERPKARVLVHVGELHVAPEHLPLQVERALARRHQRPRRAVVLYQNCTDIYWELERRGLEHDVEAVHVGPGRYALLNTPPIVCQQSFLNWLEADPSTPPGDTMIDTETYEAIFKEYAATIARTLGLELDNALDDVEVATVVDLSFLKRLRRRGMFTDGELAVLREQILQSESCYIPRARMVYLGNLSVNHASEEASHFVRHVCAGDEEPKDLVEAFYSRCVNECIGFFGSKLINHKRKTAHEPYLKETVRRFALGAPDVTEGEAELARLVLGHRAFERGIKVPWIAEVFHSDVNTFNAVTHTLGYILGDRLYYALIRGQFTKEEVRELFEDPFDDEGAARNTYFYVVYRLARVEIPERTQ